MQSHPKKIALHGALDVDNFGDVLLGRIFAKWVMDAGCVPLIPSATDVVRDQIVGVVPGSYRDADAIAYIGGGYFGEPPRSFLGRWRWGFRMLKKHVRPPLGAILRGTPYAIIGVGCGPLSNLFGRLAVRLLANRAKVAAVRDEEGAAYLKSIGVKRVVRVTADCALSMSPEEVDAGGAVKQANLPDSFAILHLDKQSATVEQWDSLIEAIKAFVSTSSQHYLFAVDQRNTPVLADQIAVFEEHFSTIENVSFLAYSGIDDMIRTIRQSSLVVTTKLHVGIVGLAMQRPVLSFPAHDKTIRLFRQVGAAERCLPYFEWDRSRIDAHLEKYARHHRDERVLSDEVIQLSLNNRAALNEFIASV